MYDELEKILILISRKSGKGAYKKIFSLLEKAFKSELDSNKAIIKVSSDEEPVTLIAKNFIKNHPKSAILVAGGDGTLHEVANVVYGSEVYLGLIPNGTANDFAKTLYGKRFTLDDIIKRSKNPKPGKIDLIKINDKFCVNIMSFGYDTVVLSKAGEILKEKPKLGAWAYLLAITKTIFRIQSNDVIYSFTSENGNEVKGQGEYILTSICNGKYYGDGFNPSPEAKPNDHLIDLSRINNVPLYKLIYLIPKYKKGSHVKYDISNNDKVKSGYFKSVDGNPLLGNIDGEIELFDEINYSIVENAINFLFF